MKDFYSQTSKITSDFSLLNVTCSLLGIDNDTDNVQHLPLSSEVALFQMSSQEQNLQNNVTTAQ